MRRFDPTSVFALSCALLAAPTIAQPIDLARARIVDLSHAYDDETVYWPNSPSGFRLERLASGPTAKGWFYSANAISTPEHGGTHIDAPVHFGEGRRSVDQIPLRQLVAPAAVIDITARAEADADYRLTAEDVVAWESSHGRIAAGSIVLLRSGWSRRWPDRKRYLGDDTPGEVTHLHFPSYGVEAARLLVEERRVGALGVNTASIDHGPSSEFPVHRVAAAAQVPGIENVNQLEALPATGAWIVALPMKIAAGSGAPLRIVALLPPVEE